MRKALFTILLAVLFVSGSLAQGFIVNIQGGYGWQPGSTQAIPAQVINTKSPYTDDWGSLSYINEVNGASKLVKNSYGHGLNIGAQLGYMFNGYLGFSVGVNYQQSKVISATQLSNFYYPDSAGVYQPTGGYLNATTSTSSQSLTVSPSLILAYNKPKNKVYPYLRAGLVLPVWTVIKHHQSIGLEGISAYGLDQPPYFMGAQTDVDMQTSTRFTMGFNGAVGVVYKPFPFLHLFVELNAQYLNMKGNTSEVKQWMADGYDLSFNRGGYRNDFEYVSKLSASSNNAQYNSAYDQNKPKQEISPNFPFSYIGFNIGVQLFLNKKIFKDMDMFEENRLLKQKEKPKKKSDSTGG